MTQQPARIVFLLPVLHLHSTCVVSLRRHRQVKTGRAIVANTRQIELALADALRRFNAGRLNEAEAICRELLAQIPKHPALQQLLAVLSLTRGDSAGAQSHVIQSLKARPEHGPTLLLAGKIALAQSDRSTAVHFFRRAALLMPDTSEAARLLGMTLLEIGSPDAIPVLQDLLARHGEDAGAWCLLGLARRRYREADAAIEAFRRAIACDVNMAAAHFHLATELLSCDRLEEAIEVFRRAHELDPDALEIAFNLGLALHRDGQAAPARTAFERACRIAPAFADAWFNLGLACQDLGDSEAAIAAFREAVVQRPDYAEATVNLGLALQQARRMDEAIQAYRDAVRLRPETVGRIAHALAGGSTGCLWLNPDALRRALFA